MLTAVTYGLETQFSKILHAEDQCAVLATVSCSFFKVKWLKDTLIAKEEEISSNIQKKKLQNHILQAEMSFSTKQLKNKPDLFENFFGVDLSV